MKITVIGHICIDHNKSEGASYVSAGGPATFFYIIHKYFPNVELTCICSYGPDFLKYSSGSHLLPNQSTQKKTLAYYNTSKGAKRWQKAKNRERKFSVEINQKMIDSLESSDVVIVAPLLPSIKPEYIKKISRYFPKNALKVLLPQGYFRSFDKNNNMIQREFLEWKKILPFFNLLFISIEDKKNMESILNFWVTKYPKLTTVMTMSSLGAKIISQKITQQVSTHAIPDDQIIDSVGSGDIFAFSFVYDYFHNQDLIAAASFANDIAAKCLKYKTEDLDTVFQKHAN